MNKSLCKKYGFNSAGRTERLMMMHLDEHDHLLATQLHENVIMPTLDELIEEFYEYMLGEKLTRQILDSHDVGKLKRTQKSYLKTLGLDFDSEEYFEKRLNIGLVHALIEMPLSLYQCSYTHLQLLIRQKIEQAERVSEQDKLALNNFTLKIISLDMSLATDTYFSSNFESLEQTVTALQSEKETLSTKVNIDSLTGISSRESIMAEANKSFNELGGDKETFSLLVADIDFFKSVNDTYGHAIGDEVLKMVAERMEHAVRGDDMVGRIGGEEFMITLPGSVLQTASVVGERIRKAVESSPIAVEKESLNVTISLGAAERMEQESLTQLIDRADKALYVAKGSGRNCVSLYAAS